MSDIDMSFGSMHDAVKATSTLNRCGDGILFNPLAIEPHLLTAGVTTAISGYYGYPITIVRANDTWEGISSLNQFIERIHNLTYDVTMGTKVGGVDDKIRYHRIRAHPPLSKQADKIWDASRLIQETGDRAKSRYEKNIIRVPLQLKPQDKQALEGLREGLANLKERASEKRDRITDSRRAINQMRDIIEDALQNNNEHSASEVNRAIAYLTMLSFTTVLSRKESEMIQAIWTRVNQA